jgi:hydroxyacylglutathione hydrolase
MIFKQFYLPSLGHASYVIGSEQTGEALALDVRRDVDVYYQFARAEALNIRYAADTHQHNDYLSGVTELKQRSPLELLTGARAEIGYRARKVGHGTRLEMGEVIFEVMETPGHTPEHISLLVFDRSRGEEPIMLLSGGALLVNDVARPDLLGEIVTAHKGAQDLRRTLSERILPLPDHVTVYPTHVSGSLCGGNIGSMLSTTIGYERRMNLMLRCINEHGDFERACLNLDTLPTIPPYWRRMRGQNQAGPAPLGILSEPSALRPKAFVKQMQHGAVVLDCRAPEAFGAGHIAGSFNVGIGNAFPTWAGTMLPPKMPLLLVLDRSTDLWDVVWNLLRIGYDLPAGWLAGGFATWRMSGQPIETLPQWSVFDLKDRLQAERDLLVLDVRQPGEWDHGRVPGALHISGGELPQRIDEVPPDRPVAVYCGSGYRSSVATSLLKRTGHQTVFNVLGGFSAWKNAGFPIAEEK